jgi:hypothetical protein
LSVVEYHNLMLDRLDKVSGQRVKTLGEIEIDKLRVTKAYNKSQGKLISGWRSYLEDDFAYWVYK